MACYLIQISGKFKNDNIINVIFSDPVTYVFDYLGSIDVFILHSRFEGLHMIALEA